MIEMQPVQVWEGGSAKRTLADVEIAARFLLEQWPPAFAGRQPYHEAREKALAALTGEGTAAEFRIALISAAVEAGILASSAPEPETLPIHVARPWYYSDKSRRNR